MARIEEFNALAGFESIHVGMTSRDVTENTEQAAILASLALTRTHALATLARLDALAVHYRDQPVVGRSHNVPAQITTLGKRFATAGEELMLGLAALDQFIESYPLRGIKGPMGTAADQSQLLSSADAAASLDAAIAEALGADLFTSVGQVYPRSLDLATVDLLIRLMSALASLAATIRLMAGTAQASEGFAKGRVGSSAMPHKMNASRSERIHGLYAALGGSHAQLAAVTGNQWYEGTTASASACGGSESRACSSRTSASIRGPYWRSAARFRLQRAAHQAYSPRLLPRRASGLSASRAGRDSTSSYRRCRPRRVVPSLVGADRWPSARCSLPPHP